MEKFESNLFMKIGNFFFNVGLNYKTGGIKAVWHYYHFAIKFKINTINKPSAKFVI